MGFLMAMDTRIPMDPLGMPSATGVWSAFLRWLGDGLLHAMGEPAELQPAAPPLVGVQPYHDRPARRSRHR